MDSTIHMDNKELSRSITCHDDQLLQSISQLDMSQLDRTERRRRHTEIMLQLA